MKLFRIVNLFLVGTLSLLVFQGAFAADKKGQYGVRGVGLISCDVYMKERKAQGEVYLMAAAWMDGYITATNQHASDTYDVASFESTELLAAVLDEHCEKRPSARVFTVLRALFEKIHQDRLLERSQKTEVVVGDRKVSLYAEVLKRVQRKLRSANFYKGKIDGDYGRNTVEAMKKFQASVSFQPTGFPDQATLWKLLRSPN